MSEQHRATADSWALIERMRHFVEFSCLIELRDRIEALEATQHAHVDASHVIDPEREKAAQEMIQAAGFSPKWNEFKRCADSIDAMNEVKPSQPNHPAKPDSSLVEQVADAIVAEATSAGIVNDRPARAAIREVAAWMREQRPWGVAFWAQLLEQEAER